MNEELDYAEMLEIPVSTVNVVKKKSIFTNASGESVSPLAFTSIPQAFKIFCASSRVKRKEFIRSIGRGQARKKHNGYGSGGSGAPTLRKGKHILDACKRTAQHGL